MENSQLTFVSPVGKMEGNEYLVRPKVALKGDLKISTNSTQNIKIRVFVDGTKTNGVIEKDLDIFQSATKTAPLSSGETYNPYGEAKYTASSSGHHRIINIKDVNLAIINSGTCHKLKFHHYNLRVELYIGDNFVCSCRSNDFIAVFRDPKNPTRTNLNNNNINNNNINNNINNNFNNNTNSNTNTNSNNNNSNNDNDKIINNSNFNNISTFPTQHQQELLQVFQSLVEENKNARIEMQIREQKMQDIISQLSQSSQSNSPASVPQNIQSDDDSNNNNNNNNDDDDDDNDDDINDNGSFVNELFQAHYQVNELYTDSPSEVDEYQFTQNINKKFKYN